MPRNLRPKRSIIQNSVSFVGIRPFAQHPFPMASQISQAIKQICDEKNIAYESVIETIQAALAAAYRKDVGNKNQNIQAEFDPEKYDGAMAGIRVFDVKTVVEDMEIPVATEQEAAVKRS